jgi:hypothetical protein
MRWLIGNLIRLRGGMLFRSLEEAATDPQRVQQTLLLNLLKKNSETEFGKKHGFGNIGSGAAYRRQVPIQDYENLEPSIQKCLEGKRSILTSDPPVRFNVTSGTTGRPKYIPVTAESQRSTSRLMQQWLYRALKDHPALLDHASLLIASPAVEGRTPAGLPYGSATGLIYENLPRLLQRAFAIPFLISEIKDYHLRYFLLARFALGRRISFIGTPNPTTLVRMAEAAVRYPDLIIRSIEEGRLFPKGHPFDLSGHASVVADLEERVRPDRARARDLTQTAQRKGFLRLGDCWPDLRLIACWLGGSIGAQAHKLYDHFDRNVPMRDFGYQASEGSFALPYQDQTPSGILALYNGYYEFLPEGDLEKGATDSLSCHELEVGKQYAILLTTLSGLYRYHINDIIEVTDWYRKTPLIKFIRKGRDVANITGEKVHVNQLIAAVDAVKGTLALPLNQFRVIPHMEESRYDFYLELAEAVSSEFLLERVIRELDRSLSELNIEYRQKRDSLRLNPPRILIMRRGWEEEDRRRFVNSGRKDAQYKWQTLATAPTPLDHEFIQQKIDPIRPHTAHPEGP